MTMVCLPTSELLDAVRAPEGLDTQVWDGTGTPARAEEVRVVVAPYMSAPSFVDGLAATPAVELLQLQSAGYDGLVERLPAGVALANAAGVHDAATAELAVGLAIASLRGVPDMLRDQDAHRWPAKTFRPSLADRRVLLLGYGSVGAAIARRLAPFEVSLTAVAGGPRPGDGVVEHVHGVAELPRLLPDQEVVVVAVPLTERTRGLVDESFLRALPDGALLVNVARGPVVDTAAVLAQSGRLRFALDVTDPEPLPPDHPLWDLPDTIITPHVGGVASSMQPRIVRLVERQLTAYVRGEPWLNVVHP